MILPVQTELTAPYWEAARSGHVLLQVCADCRLVWHPPAPSCLRCRSTAWSWQAASGLGTVHSITRVAHPVHAQVADAVPYLLALVRLAEGPLFLCGVDDPSFEAVLVDGAAVRIELGTAAGGAQLPMARPAGRAGRA